MKGLPTEISPGINNFFSLTEKEDDFFKVPFHYHPELELVFILESFGKRIIGDNTGTFNEGDLVFIGSNLPHAWVSDEIFQRRNPTLRPKAIVLYFNKDIFSQGFYEMKEAVKINELFKAAEKGICVNGKTKAVIEIKLKSLLHKEDFEKIIGLFEVLHILSQSDDMSFVVSDGYASQLKHTKTDRLAEVYKYIEQNFKDNISLSTIAAISNLAPQSFCRVFKKRTGKSFVA